MSLSLLGAGALLSASSVAFTTMKTIGGVYLLYLGVRALLSARAGTKSDQVAAVARQPESALRRFSKASTITMLNPKSILFFVAFVPQFINPARTFAPQAAILLVTFVMLAMLNAWVYMFFAGLLGRRLESQTAQPRIGVASGSVLLGAGALTLSLKRP